MGIPRIENISEHPPVKNQELKRIVKKIRQEEKAVQPADANDRGDEKGEGKNINKYA